MSYLIILLNCFVAILITPCMVKMLGQSQYGLYQLIDGLVGYMIIFDFGLNNTIIRYVAQYRQQKDNKGQSNLLGMIIVIYLVISVLTIIISTILYFNLNKIFGKSLTPKEMNEAKIMFIILVTNLVLSLPGGAFGAIINGYEKYIFPRAITVARILIRIVLLVLLLKVGYKAIAIVTLDLFLNIIVILINIYICKTQLNVQIKFCKFNTLLLIEVLSFSFFIFLNLVIDQTILKINQTIIGIKMSTTAVAVYAVGITFSSFFTQFSGAIQGVFLPKVTKMVIAGASNDDLTNLMIRVGRLQAIILSYIFIAFILLGRQFIQLWVGDSYTDAWIIALLIMCGLLLPLMQTVGLAILQAKKKHQFYVLTYLVISIFSVLVSIFIVDIIGIVGPAVTIMIGLIIGHLFPINWYYNFKIGLNMVRFFKELLKGILSVSIISCLISFILIKFIEIKSWTMFVAQGVIFTAIYFVCIWFFAANNYEKNLFLSIVSKYRTKNK